MEEEMVKRNTDCVYFLASPFTCKKGAECEYRHNEMARLNPQDCWFWLTNTCLNPTCAFRHPPLDVHTEATPKSSASLASHPSVPATKSTVPCYFYLNGFCKKGDRCPFIHQSNEFHSSKPKMINTVSDIPVHQRDIHSSKPKMVNTVSGIPVDQRGIHSSKPKMLNTVSDIPVDQRGIHSSKPKVVNIVSDIPVDQPDIHSSKPEMAHKVSDISVQSLETKTPRSDLETVLAKNTRSLFEMAIKSSDGFQALQKQLAEQQASNAELALSKPTQATAENHEETAVVDDDAPLQPVELSPKSECEPISGSAQSSEEPLDGNIVQDEWCESSPGFDVLADEKADDVIYDYEDDHDYEYLCALNGNNGDHKGFLIHHGIDHNECVERLYFRDGLYNSSELIHDEYVPHQSFDRVGDRVSLKRKLLSADLRNYLRQRRVVDDETNHLSHRIRDDRHGGFNLQLHGRLTSKSGRKVTRSESRKKNMGIEANQRSKRSKSMSRGSGNSRRRNESKKRPSVKRVCESSVYTTFDGPKSLAEIKEEKSKGRLTRNGSSVDFDGPKPLSEILKAKKQTSLITNNEVSDSF